jgi:tetratricopeptide (TPR) repeat protein
MSPAHRNPTVASRVLVSRMRRMSWLRRNGKRLLRLGAGAALLVSLCAVAFAQAPATEPRTAITVSGTVRDISGSVVADVSVFLEEKATDASVEARTKSDGTFSFLALRAGTYVVRARMQGFKDAVSDPMELSLGEKKEIELVMNVAHGGGVVVEGPPLRKPGTSKSGDMEFSDKPSFTVAGVTDWTNVGGHGSDTKLRTSESLAKETAALKSGEPGETSANASETARDADSHRALGDRAERSGDALAAEREYEEAVRLNPSEQNYFAWGTELLLHRAVKPAAEVFEKGSAAHPKSARMLAGLGAALYASGDYANAARRVCAAADLQPGDATPYLFLGKMEKAAPDPLPCIEQKLAQFARTQPASAQANYYYAVSLWKSGRGKEDSANLQQAEALLQRAVAADPKFDEAYVQLGVVCAARGNSQQAIHAYKKAVEVNPQSAEAHYRLGLAYKRAGDEEKAEQELRLYKEADKTETAAVERQRREIRQFLIILKDQKQ